MSLVSIAGYPVVAEENQEVAAAIIKATQLRVEGKYADAESFLKSTIASARVDASEMARLLNNLGLTYARWGRLNEADACYRKALEPGGQLSPVMRTLYEHNLAQNLARQGRLNDAEKVYRAGLATVRRERLSGAPHAAILGSLGSLLIDQNRLDEAQRLLSEKVEEGASDEALGLYHARILDLLGELYLRAGNREAGVESLNRALSKIADDGISERAMRSHILNRMAVAEWQLGRGRDAEEHWRQSIAGFDQLPGALWFDSAYPVVNLATMLAKKKRIGEAMRLLDVAADRIKTNPSGLPWMVDAVLTMAATYSRMRQFDRAEELLNWVLSKTVTERGAGHPDAGIILGEMAALRYLKGNVAESNEIYRRAGAILERAGKQHTVQLAANFERHARVLRKLKKRAEAEELEDRARSIRALQPERHTTSVLSMRRFQ